MQILFNIENRIQDQKKYLRGALKIFQNKDISPSKLAETISNKLPLRSEKFTTSLESCL